MAMLRRDRNAFSSMMMNGCLCTCVRATARSETPKESASSAPHLRVVAHQHVAARQEADEHCLDDKPRKVKRRVHALGAHREQRGRVRRRRLVEAHHHRHRVVRGQAVAVDDAQWLAGGTDAALLANL